MHFNRHHSTKLGCRYLSLSNEMFTVYWVITVEQHKVLGSDMAIYYTPSISVLHSLWYFLRQVHFLSLKWFSALPHCFRMSTPGNCMDHYDALQSLTSIFQLQVHFSKVLHTVHTTALNVVPKSELFFFPLFDTKSIHVFNGLAFRSHSRLSNQPNCVILKINLWKYLNKGPEIAG